MAEEIVKYLVRLQVLTFYTPCFSIVWYEIDQPFLCLLKVVNGLSNINNWILLLLTVKYRWFGYNCYLEFIIIAMCHHAPPYPPVSYIISCQIAITLDRNKLNYTHRKCICWFVRGLLLNVSNFNYIRFYICIYVFKRLSPRHISPQPLLS